MQHTPSATFRIVGADATLYGPIELPTLIEWTREERITPSTWILDERVDTWKRASDLPELGPFLPPPPSQSEPDELPPHDSESRPPNSSAAASLKPGALRRIKVFAELSQDQLERFLQFMEITSVKQWTEVVKQGDHGDAMYLVLEGELRVRILIGGKESILATLGVGEFFGEIALFDQGPRSADVIANHDSRLLKITSAAFQSLLRQAPELAAPFLFAVGKTLMARIRADNKRYRDTVAFSRSAR